MKDKVVFTVALIGVVLAATPFTEQLGAVPVDFGFLTCSILTLIYITFGMLILSVYIYALDYIRYGFKKFDGVVLFKYIQFIANSLYFLSILSPIIYLVTWGIVRVYRLIPFLNLHLPQLPALLSLISTTIAAIITIVASWKQYKDSRIAQEEVLDQSAADLVNEAQQLVKRKMWSLAFQETFRSLELNVRKKLLEMGFDSKRVPFFRSADILVHYGIITEDEREKLNRIRTLRNEAVYSSIEFTKEEALDLIKVVKNILPKLETKTTGIERVKS